MDRFMARVIVAVIAALIINAAFTLVVVAISQHQYNRQQAGEKAAGLLVERRICSTLLALASNKPPAGNPQANPSRAYDQRNHAILDGLAPDLGCRHGR